MIQDGTAWKKENTSDLTFQALSNGFTALDTACQPKHYREDLVGEGLRRAIAETSLNRADVYVQTKFTSIRGQDPNNIPYDPKKPVVEQVKQSIEVSLKHFDVSKNDQRASENPYLDGLVLHSPMPDIEATMEVWHTLETYVPEQIRNIGISNCDLSTLTNVYERARIKPAVVQNRFDPRTRYDIGVRKFCHDNNIIYQSFWTLTANPDLVRSQLVGQVASHLGISRESTFYCLVLSLGDTVILNGTTKPKHMQEDWAALKKAQEFSASYGEAWDSAVNQFKDMIGQKS